MRWVLVLLALTLVALASTAPASAVEPGFRYSYPLAKRAVKISGMPEARVYCAISKGAWERFTEENTDLSAYPNGLTNRQTKEMFLPKYICLPLEQKIKGKRPYWFDLGIALLTFGHEAAHVKGIRSEIAAERFSCRNAPRIARAFGVRTTKAVRRAVSIVRTEGHC